MRNVLFLLVVSFLLAQLSCQSQDDNHLKSKANAPPSITSVRILPENPTRENELSLSIQSQDPDRDPVAYSYQWIRNGEEVVGEKKSSLLSGSFKKGDSIQIRVTPSDGKLEGKPFLSPPIKIVNSPPVLQEVWIEPKVAYAGDTLKIHTKSLDADGDFIYYTYRWEKNGVALAEENKETLEKGRFKKGDAISVTVIPDDRESQGKPKASEPLTVSNSPPVIVSTPPTSVEGSKYTYQVKVNDPDNDPVTFSLKTGAKGMEIDKSTGLMRWVIGKQDQGTHTVEIQASDSDGGTGLQRYTLTISIR